MRPFPYVTVRHAVGPDATQAVAGRPWSRPRRVRLYSSGRGYQRSRRATDFVLLTLCAVGLLTFAQLSEPPSALEDALLELAAAIPSFLDVVWRVGAGLLMVWGALLVTASLVRWRLDILRDQLLAIAGSLALVSAIDQVAGDVSAQVAIVTAATVVASPHIARPFRLTSRWLLALGAVSLVILEDTTPSGAVLGLLCGASAAAIVHLLLGSSGGRPSLDDVRRGLEELGVTVAGLSEAERQHAGVYVLDGIDGAGTPLVVKVYGRDAWDSQLLAKAWRALWYRDAEAVTLTRVQQAEHEAFTTLLAARNGVPVQDVVRAGRTTSNDALLVLRSRGLPVAAAGGRVEPPVLEAMWDTALALADAGFAHGDLGPGQFRMDGDQAVIDGLAGVAIAPTPDQRRIDLAQLLVTCALLSDGDAAVDVARRRLGAEGLAGVLPYLQVAALGTRLRAAIATAELDLDDLRALAASAAGVEEPKLAKLRRVSTGSVVRAGLLAAAGYFLISTFAGIEWSDLVDALRDASIALLVLALLIGQLPRFAQAESTRGACPRPIPYGLVVLLQFAITFVNLAIPSTAARVAVNIRFFQRQGIPPASAVSIGVIDSACGFVTQLLLLGSILLFGLGGVELDVHRPSDLHGGDLLHLLVVAATVVVAVAIIAMVLPKPRAWVLERVRPWLREAMETLSTLRSPVRLAQVFGGNLTAEVLFACTLGITLAAFGKSLPLATLLLINVCVSLFAGIMPIPGGIGVAEGALVLGLTAAGISDAVALGATLTYRMCTFYLPPLWGAVAFRRLERNGYL